MASEQRKEYMRVWNQKWRDANREKFRKYHREYKRKKRGIMKSRFTDKVLSNFVLGRKYEELALSFLLNSKLNDSYFGADLIWNNKTVEVKTRRIRQNGWSFRRNKTNSDYYIFFCLSLEDKIEKIYLFPSNKFGKTIFFSKNKTYNKYIITAPQ